MSIDVLSIGRATQSLNEQVVAVVRDAIATGNLAPGQRLTEREMMERTGVGRTSIREAMSQLRAIGLVEERSGGGFQVANLDKSTIEHIYEIRAAIEPVVAELFTLRATDAEVAELLGVAGFYESTTSDLELDLDGLPLPVLQEDLLFRGARSPLLREVIEPFYVRIQRVRRLSLTMAGRYEASQAELREVLDAIRRRMPEKAAQASRRHITAAQASALTALEQSNSGPVAAAVHH